MRCVLIFILVAIIAGSSEFLISPVNAGITSSDLVTIGQAPTSELREELIRQYVTREQGDGSLASIGFLDFAIGLIVKESDRTHSHSLISTMSADIADRVIPNALPIASYYRALRDLVEIAVAARSIELDLPIRRDFLLTRPKRLPSSEAVAALRDIRKEEGVQLNIPLLPVLFEIENLEELTTGMSSFIAVCDRESNTSIGTVLDGPKFLLELSEDRLEHVAALVCTELAENQFGVSIKMSNDVALAATAAAPAAQGVLDRPDDHEVAQRLRLLIALLYTELQKRGELEDSKLGDVAPAMLFDVLQNDIPNRPGLEKLGISTPLIDRIRRKVPAAYFFSGNNQFLLERYEELMNGAGDVGLWIGAMNGALIGHRYKKAAEYGCLVATTIEPDRHQQLWWTLDRVVVAYPHLFDAQDENCRNIMKAGIEAFNQSNWLKRCKELPLLCLPAYNDISLVLSLMARFDPLFLKPLIQLHTEILTSSLEPLDGFVLDPSGYMGLLISDLRIIRQSVSWKKNDVGLWVRQDLSEQATAFDFVDTTLKHLAIKNQDRSVKYSAWRVNEDEAETNARFLEAQNDIGALKKLRSEADRAIAAGRPQLFLKLWILERLDFPLYQHRLAGKSWSDYKHTSNSNNFQENDEFLKLLDRQENDIFLKLWDAAQQIESFLVLAFPK